MTELVLLGFPDEEIEAFPAATIYQCRPATGFMASVFDSGPAYERKYRVRLRRSERTGPIEREEFYCRVIEQLDLKDGYSPLVVCALIHHLVAKHTTHPTTPTGVTNGELVDVVTKDEPSYPGGNFAVAQAGTGHADT